MQSVYSVLALWKQSMETNNQIHPFWNVGKYQWEIQKRRNKQRSSINHFLVRICTYIQTSPMMYNLLVYDITCEIVFFRSINSSASLYLPYGKIHCYTIHRSVKQYHYLKFMHTDRNLLFLLPRFTYFHLLFVHFFFFFLIFLLFLSFGISCVFANCIYCRVYSFSTSKQSAQLLKNDLRFSATSIRDRWWDKENENGWELFMIAKKLVLLIQQTERFH